MLTYEYKLAGKPAHYAASAAGIRVVQFLRNKCLRAWRDRMEQGHACAAMSAYTAVLAQRFPFAKRLGSQARQAAAQRAGKAGARCYANCQHPVPGKKGSPRFQRDCRRIEYTATAGWHRASDGRHVTCSDGLGIGTLRLVGTRSLETVPDRQLQRVRLIRRADGDYVQFCVDAERNVDHTPTGKQTGIARGRHAFYTDRDGNTVANPRQYRKAEKQLKKLHQRVSRKKKGSNNRQQSRKTVAKEHLKVQRQREEHARKQACALVTSSDLMAFEDLQVRNLVKNHFLAKSSSDAGWSQVLGWVQYYARLHGIACVAVPPTSTSHACSGCQALVKKSLSVRTHCGPHCGLLLDREVNAALNILQEALRLLGHRRTATAGPERTLGDRGASGNGV